MSQSRFIQCPHFVLEIESEVLNLFSPYETWFAESEYGTVGIGHTDSAASLQLILRQNPDTGRLQLLWTQPSGVLHLEVSCATWIDSLHRGLASKKGPMNQAIGKKTRTVFDASGGWGNDALLFARQGLLVVSAERHPLLAMLLHQAMQSLCTVMEREGLAGFSVPQIVFGPADSVYAELQLRQIASPIDEFDCVYFDPMFPPKRNKAAKSNKQMQFTQSLLNGDPDAAATALALLAHGVQRLVVKRPHHADPLLPGVSTTFTANLVDYDVYLRH